MATGCILLNHPERIGGIFTLGMLCPGDVVLNSDGDNQVPYYSPSLFPWWWHCSFGTIKACEASPKFGNMTAFVSRDISLND